MPRILAPEEILLNVMDVQFEWAHEETPTVTELLRFSIELIAALEAHGYRITKPGEETPDVDMPQPPPYNPDKSLIGHMEERQAARNG